MSKPITPQVNWASSLADGLIWNVAPGPTSRTELLSKTSGTLLTSGTWTGQTLLGGALNSSSTTNGGAFWPWTKNIERITNQFTIIVFAKLDALSAFSKLLCIPYHWTIGGANTTATSTTANGITANSIMTCYGVVVNSSQSVFYKNGLALDTVATGMGGNLDFGDKREVTLFNHNSGDPGEGSVGQTPFAAIWNRVLSATEMKAIYTNPWQIYTKPIKTPLNTGV